MLCGRQLTIIRGTKTNHCFWAFFRAPRFRFSSFINHYCTRSTLLTNACASERNCRKRSAQITNNSPFYGDILAQIIVHLCAGPYDEKTVAVYVQRRFGMQLPGFLLYIPWRRRCDFIYVHNTHAVYLCVLCELIFYCTAEKKYACDPRENTGRRSCETTILSLPLYPRQLHVDYHICIVITCTATRT